MNKREIELLERAFSAEIEAALNHGIRLMQTKSKLAKKLVEDGFLVESKMTLPGRLPIVIAGYELTHAGRFAYCLQCEDGGIE